MPTSEKIYRVLACVTFAACSVAMGVVADPTVSIAFAVVATVYGLTLAIWWRG